MSNIGQTGGTAKDSIVAGTITGDITQSNTPGSRNVTMGNQQGQFSMGDQASNIQGASNVQSKAENTMTSSELVEHLRSCECSAETIESFTKERVTGSLFVSQFDEVLQLLNITNKFEIMRLKNLKKKLSQ